VTGRRGATVSALLLVAMVLAWPAAASAASSADELVRGQAVGVPGAPTITDVGYGPFEDGVIISVYWDPPASDGGSPITAYTATANPGGATCSTTDAEVCTFLDGIIPGIEYTITVVATNAIGDGPPSAPSDPITPTTCMFGGPSLRRSFSDVNVFHPFCFPIQWLTAHEIAEGFPDGSYRPLLPITRQAMAAMIFRYVDPDFDPPSAATFDDVPTGHPFFAEIEWLVAEDLASGYPDGTFHPLDVITRQSAAALLYRLAGEPPTGPPALGDFNDVPPSHPFYDEIAWMVNEEITTGFPGYVYGPRRAVSRQTVAAFLWRYESNVA
jgi:hypothetical protein